MYKLAKVEHYRCDQPAGKWGLTTYVWVPINWTAETLQTYVDLAVKSYLDTEAEFKKLWVPHRTPGYGVTVTAATPDTKTVKELRDEYEAEAKAYNEYQEMVKKSRHQFAWHLNEVSGGAVLQFWENKPELSVEANWGHNHGVTIEHGETKLRDYPSKTQDDDEEDV
jgi:hypothetical protein